MDGAGLPKSRLGTGTPTVDSITEGVRIIPIKVDAGYRNASPSDGATDLEVTKPR